MKTRILFMAALATLAFVGCTSDEFVGENSPNALQNANGAITFGFDLQNATRANQEGATAAATLGNQFIVWGEKGETSGDAPTAGNLVFNNYQVNYVDNSAYTSTSNTKDWEYVGYTHSAGYQSNITGAYSVAQTIKYWDYSATSYTFTAVSAKQSDITDGKVKIAKTTSGANQAAKGYVLTLTAAADPTKIYVADRKNIVQGTGTDRTAANAYGGNVQLQFRNLVSQVRAAMYETIPGYTVKIKKFYTQDSSTPTFDDMTTGVTANFAANVPNVGTGSAAKLTITYDASNRPTVAVADATTSNTIALGTNLKKDKVLATSIVLPTYDTDGGTYTSFFPQETNNKSLKLKLDYTLTSTDGSNETIEVTGATAEVPAEYLQWKPNYKYTYIFKISENTNGSTGGDVVGLYPITFDAVVVVAEDGLAEYITTVSEPSITTFGVKSSVYSTGEADYKTGTDIYATIVDNSSIVDFTLGTNVNVYKVTTSDATNFPITEASVAEALAETSVGAKKITCTNVNADATTNFTAAPVKVATVPSENGGTITINALKLSGVKDQGTFAVEYIKTAATYHTETVTIANQGELDTYLASGKLYTNADGTTEASATYDAMATYYRRTAVKTVGTYAYKIITIKN